VTPTAVIVHAEGPAVEGAALWRLMETYRIEPSPVPTVHRLHFGMPVSGGEYLSSQAFRVHFLGCPAGQAVVYKLALEEHVTSHDSITVPRVADPFARVMQLLLSKIPRSLSSPDYLRVALASASLPLILQCISNATGSGNTQLSNAGEYARALRPLLRRRIAVLAEAAIRSGASSSAVYRALGLDDATDAVSVSTATADAWDTFRTGRAPTAAAIGPAAVPVVAPIATIPGTPQLAGFTCVPGLAADAIQLFETSNPRSSCNVTSTTSAEGHTIVHFESKSRGDTTERKAGKENTSPFLLPLNTVLSSNSAAAALRFTITVRKGELFVGFVRLAPSPDWDGMAHDLTLNQLYSSLLTDETDGQEEDENDYGGGLRGGRGGRGGILRSARARRGRGGGGILRRTDDDGSAESEESDRSDAEAEEEASGVDYANASRLAAELGYWLRVRPSRFGSAGASTRVVQGFKHNAVLSPETGEVKQSVYLGWQCPDGMRTAAMYAHSSSFIANFFAVWMQVAQIPL
jgi:hypothetical protein